MRAPVAATLGWNYFPTAHGRVMELGARVLAPAVEGGDFQVYADPAGHPFCLCFAPGDASLPERMTIDGR